MMKIIADLQLHSRFSRACSKNINLEQLEKYAKIKGLGLLSTGDFQHPKWNQEIKNELKEDENGILWSKNKFPFIWGTEISLMYSDNGRRAVHLLLFSPNGETSDQIIEALSKRGRIDYDGRPIFGMSCPEVVEIMKEINEEIEIIPAHCMTSFFGVFGSKSGFSSLKECFKEKRKKIHAIETGISADPEMLSKLNEDVNFVSFSDAHSFHPYRLGREATTFSIQELTAKNVIKSMKTGEGINSTIETYPEYGKYHYSGHRNCNIFRTPEEIKKYGKMCPVCGKELTVGVEDRINELTKRESKIVKPYSKIIPLQELISSVYSVKQINSKTVSNIYTKLIRDFKNELNILLNVSGNELLKSAHEKLVNLIIQNRENKLKIEPGYDGVYGKIMLKEEEIIKKQKSLSDF